MIGFRSIQYKEDKTPYVELKLVDENDNDGDTKLTFDNENITVNWINSYKSLPDGYMMSSSSSVDELDIELYTWVYAIGSVLYSSSEIDRDSEYLEIPVLTTDLIDIHNFEQLTSYYRENNI
jgi:hypothetical protein